PTVFDGAGKRAGKKRQSAVGLVDASPLTDVAMQSSGPSHVYFRHPQGSPSGSHVKVEDIACVAPGGRAQVGGRRIALQIEIQEVGDGGGDPLVLSGLYRVLAELGGGQQTLGVLTGGGAA